MAVSDQVARPLPAFYVVGGVAPGGAWQVAVALQELEIHRRLVQLEALEKLVDILEFLMDIISRHENFAIVHGRVAICRRKLVTVDIKLRQIFIERFNFFHVGFLVNGGISAHQETSFLSDFNGVYRLAKNAFPLHADIMSFLEAVEMHVEEKTAVRFELVQTFADEHSVGTQIDVLVAFEDAADQLSYLRIHHGLAAADGNHRRAALIHRRQALLERNPFRDAGFVFADPAATGASKIAGV